MVILHAFIVKTTITFFLKLLPYIHIPLNLPLLKHLQKVSDDFTSPEHYLFVREKMAMFSLFRNHVSERNNDL